MNYISYSGFKLYSKCPYAYWLRYIGAVPLEVPYNCANSLFGIVVGALFEDFYNEKLWRDKQREETLKNRIEDKIRKALKEARQKGSVLLWHDKDPMARYTSLDELREDVKEAIPRGLQSIRYSRLLGPYAEAEVKQKNEVVNLLKRVDPANSSKYQQILE